MDLGPEKIKEYGFVGPSVVNNVVKLESHQLGSMVPGSAVKNITFNDQFRIEVLHCNRALCTMIHFQNESDPCFHYSLLKRLKWKMIEEEFVVEDEGLGQEKVRP